jgi:TolA-binding protein
MSIKPVDFQVIIPKATEASKVSNDMAQRNLAAQQQIAAMQQKIDSSLSQVYSRTKPQNAKINEKQKEDSRDGERKKKGKSDDKEDKSLNKAIQTSTIDIKI